MDTLCKALEDTGFMPFIAAGVAVGYDDLPRLRLAGDANIVRKISDESWQIMRDTLVNAIDKMRSAPLDDLSRG